MYIWGFSFPSVGFLVLPGRFYMPMVAPLVGFPFFSCSFFFLPTSACDYSGFPFPLGISTCAVDVSYELGVPIRGRVSFMAITLLKTPVRFLMVTTLRLGFNLSACVINPLRMKEVAPHPSTLKIVCCCWLWR
jgi:hypothetical protein